MKYAKVMSRLLSTTTCTLELSSRCGAPKKSVLDLRLDERRFARTHRRPAKATRCHAMLLCMGEAQALSWSQPSPPATVISTTQSATPCSPLLQQIAGSSTLHLAPPLVDTLAAPARAVDSGYDDAATRHSPSSRLLFLASSSLPSLVVENLLSSLSDTWDDLLFSLADWTDELADSSTLLFSSPASPSHSSLSPAILLAALGAGLATSLSPCTVSMVPLTLGFIAARPQANAVRSSADAIRTPATSSATALAAGRREEDSGSAMYTASASATGELDAHYTTSSAPVMSASRDQSTPSSGPAVAERPCCCCSEDQGESLAQSTGDSDAALAASPDGTPPAGTSRLTSDALIFVSGTASSRACMGAAAAMAGQMYGEAFGEELWLTLPLIVAAVAVLMGLNLLGLSPSLNLNLNLSALQQQQWQQHSHPAAGTRHTLTNDDTNKTVGNDDSLPSSSSPSSSGGSGVGAGVLLPRPAQLYLSGAAFAFVAAPCCTPVLASLLAYVASTEVS